MRLSAAIMIVALVGCGGGNSDSGGSDGGGATPTTCTLAITGPVTQGTYESCQIMSTAAGYTIDARGLPGCPGCGFVANVANSSPNACSPGVTRVYDFDSQTFPDGLAQGASSDISPGSCTIATSQLDLAGGHWSGSFDAFVVASDMNFQIVGEAKIQVSGGF
ncbi:MAG TPA: hypothetical protein VGL86_10715 [Polyangia bacterium]|jgi:hypothetical protein